MVRPPAPQLMPPEAVGQVRDSKEGPGKTHLMDRAVVPLHNHVNRLTCSVSGP